MPSREQIEAPAPRVRYLELLQRAVAYIDSHLAEPLTADRLAEQAAMSRHHFHRIFRAYFGTTVAGYVTWRRLQRACELLAADGAPVRGVPQPPPAGVQPELGSGPALGLHGAPVCGVPPPPSARSQPELGGGPALGLRPASVLDVALAVGYDSSQALAKAMRRELDTTPTAVRAGAQPDWKRLFDRRPGAATNGEDTMLKPQMTDCPELHVLTTTGRGMQGGNMQSAADQGFGELMPAVQRAGL
ncbi:MAG: AraC family transcriptional regulator, partial [Pseudomonadota bacterium]